MHPQQQSGYAVRPFMQRNNHWRYTHRMKRS
jgi:hypothetical protein